MATEELKLGPRNDRLGLAQRGWTNLLLIERSFKDSGDGHVVTQLVETLLTVLVFPHEGKLFENTALSSLNGWPLPTQKIGKTETLGKLIWHMRNSVCHARVKFYGDAKEGPDSRFVDQISIEFSDKPHPRADVNWRVLMEGRDIKLFLFKLLDQLHDGYPGQFE
jgi:hypothetical protein